MEFGFNNLSEIYDGEYKGNVSPVNINYIDRKEKVNAVIATLKTPIRIKLNEIKETMKGGKTLISGTVFPPFAVYLKILCDDNVIAKIKSGSDGRFDYIWIPEIEGKYFIKVTHDGSEFTMPAESNIVEVFVKAPPKPITTPGKSLTETTSKEEKVVMTPTTKKTPGFELILGLIGVLGALVLRKFS